MFTDGRRPQSRHRRPYGHRWWRVGALALVTLAALLPMPFRSPAEAAETAGLGVILADRGKITSSYDAEGTEGPAGELTVHKPAGATVRRAVLLAATTGFTSATLSGPVTVSVDGADPREVLLGHGTPSGVSSYNYWADATAALQRDLDAAPAGDVGLHVVEPAPESSVDGVILAVIFNDPGKAEDSSVTLLFGALQTGGDQFNLQLERPFRANDPAAQMQMSLGISYSCQTAGPCGSSGQQYSEIEVDGKRVTSAAGGEDDGVTANGGLITVGGSGDTADNPADPNATPTNPRSDDELYDLRPFLTDGQTSIKVDTRNPSGDDNIFFAAFDGNPPIGDITTGGDQFVYVALGDSYSSGEGAGFGVRPSATYLSEGYENGSNFPPQVGPQENTYRDGNTCHRALLNYAKINRDRFKPNAQIVLVDRTCSGATIENPSSGTKPPIVGDGGVVDSRSQVRQAIDRLGGNGLTASDVDLVTVGMGGNDAGFGTIVATCLLPAMSRIILQKYSRSPSEIKLVSNLLSCEAVDTYGTKTDTLIKALQAKEMTAQRAILASFPSAQVMQLDYPNILPTKNAPDYCGGIAKDDIEFARKKIKKIDESVRKAVKETNDPRLSVAEMEPAFGANALCPATAGTALANGIGKDAVEREVTRLLADAPTRQRLDTLVDRYNDYKKCLANHFNPFSSCDTGAAQSRLKTAASSLMTQMKNQENNIFANLVSEPAANDDTTEVANDRSRGLFHPNAKGFTVMACQVLASYEARTGDDCPSSPVPPVSTANGQFVGSLPLRVNARSTVDLLLAGFQSATQVVLTMFSEPQPLGTATTDSSGTVRTRITLPDLPGGVHRLQVEGRSPDGTAFTKEVRLDVPGRPNGSYAAYMAGFDKEPAVIDPATEAELVDVTLNGEPVGTYEPDEEGGVLVEVPLSGRITGPADFNLRAVSRRTGKAVTTVAANPVPVASSVWATSKREDAIRVIGAGIVADGRVHSEGGIVVRSSTGALTGGVEYASRLSTTGSNVKITPAARQVAAGQGTPAQSEIAEYRPGGKAATSATKYTAIRKSDCRNGVWTPARGVKLTGVVYVPCAVLVSGPTEPIDATIAAEGKIVVAAASVTIGPEAGGPSLVSGASGAHAIDLLGSRVQTRGVVHAPRGEVVVAGSAGRLTCGVQADTITMAATGLTAPMAARCLTAS